MNYRDLAKRIIATWEGEFPDELEGASEEENAEWQVLVEEVIAEMTVEELDKDKDKEEDDT